MYQIFRTMGKGIILIALVLVMGSCSSETKEPEAAENEISAEVPGSAESEQLKATLEKLTSSSVTVSGSAGNVRIESDGTRTRTIPKERMEIGGTGMKQTVACNGEHVLIDGMQNDITLSGRAGYLEITGNGHTIFVEAANEIEVNGNNNKIYWEKEVSGKKPQVTQTGSGNVIEKRNN